MFVVEDILNKMTLEEKAKLVVGADFLGTYGNEELGIPRIQVVDGGTGINFEQLFGNMTQRLGWKDGDMNGTTTLFNVIENYYEPEKLNAEEKELYTWIKEKLENIIKNNLDSEEYAPGCFPPGILLGATWNKDVVYKMGQALGIEGKIFGINMLLGTPNVNIHRDPLNGRLFEGYSEDPFLVSSLAPELVKGVQEYGILANVKHFAANNQETNRVGINETISKRALEEIYFPGFKACVTEGKVKTVMSAYNKINGCPCTENKWLLEDKLRNEWGFDGFVVSDWGAVANNGNAVKAGNDLAMPGPISHKNILNAVAEGAISEKDVDKATERILYAISWLYDNERKPDVTKEEAIRISDKAAYDAALEGIVMLENDGTFPLADNIKIILAGSGAKKLIECGQGSAGINTSRVGNLLGELTKHQGTGNVVMAKNYDEIRTYKSKDEFQGDKSIIIAVLSLQGMEGNDRNNLKLMQEDIDLMESLEDKAGVILNTCGPVDMSWKKDNVCGVWAAFLPGMEGAHALADIVCGKKNPSGKLPITFPVRYEDTPTYINFPGDGWEVNYGEGIYVGYRYYDKKNVEPMYAFGYGKSYTQFACTLCEIITDSDSVDATDAFEEKCEIIVQITNTGDMAGAEVVQLYVSDPVSTLPKPVKELKGFEKVMLHPGETKKIKLTLDKDAVKSYDNNLGGWYFEEGYYDIILATSSKKEDVFAVKRVYCKGKTPYSFGADSPIKVIYDNPQLKEIISVLCKKYSLDIELFNNNYQYTAHRTLNQIIKEAGDEKISSELKTLFLNDFNNMANTIIKN